MKSSGLDAEVVKHALNRKTGESFDGLREKNVKVMTRLKMKFTLFSS
jgi:hypothetical protein